jgi:glycerol-3-phosphate dehydrogenase
MHITTGIHLVFSRNDFPIEHTLSLEAKRDARPIYIVPWENYIYVGTTDQQCSLEDFQADKISEGDIEYLLETLKIYFPSLKWNRDWIIGYFIGARPLVGYERIDKGKFISPQDRSRDYFLEESPKGFLTLTGGKLTTFLLMGQQAVKHVLLSDSVNLGEKYLKCLSESLPIILSSIEPSIIDKSSKEIQLRKMNYFKKCEDLFIHSSLKTLPIDYPQILFERYECEGLKILEFLCIQSEPQFFHCLSSSLLFTLGELVYICENEWVQKLDDLIFRRTLIGFDQKSLIENLKLREDLIWVWTWVLFKRQTVSDDIEKIKILAENDYQNMLIPISKYFKR